MMKEAVAREQLLARVMAFAAGEGIAGKSLREIALGVGSSHRMLLYHFGSREGLLAAIVAAIEAQQRVVMVSITQQARTPREVMLGLWEQLTRPELLPFVRLFFEVFGLVAQGAPGTEGLRESLTGPWLTDAGAVAEQLGLPADQSGLRLAIAVTRGLLLDVVAGAPLADVDAAYRQFVDLYDRATSHADADPTGQVQPGVSARRGSPRRRASPGPGRG
jgi:AcrR family transcriptional regulator